MNISTEVSLARITLKNPVMTMSGTFGAGEEYSEFVDSNKPGMIVTKDIATVPRADDPTPRLAETLSGMLNAIGLQNPGVDVFLERDLSFLKRFDIRVAINIYGHSEEEYVEVVERLCETSVDFLELNISCPNVKEDGTASGTQAKTVEHITHRVEEKTAQPLIVKFSPNVTDITETVRATEANGADVLSLINALTGMKIDIMRRGFVPANRTGGPSGSTVHPVVVHMVYDCAHAAELPLTSVGGISATADIIEMILAGATVISVGAANFYNPCILEEVVTGIATYLGQTGAEDIGELIGAVRWTRERR